MAVMMKRLLIVLLVAASPFVLGLLFTYDIIKIEWISFMEIQPSFRTQEDPLPMPERSVPVQGAAFVQGLGAPVNPQPAGEASIERGKELYSHHCALCHGPEGKGNGVFAVFLQNKPTSLLEGNAKTGSDGALFMTISEGVPGAMPPLRENLPTADERWDVVNYLRHLQEVSTP